MEGIIGEYIKEVVLKNHSYFRAGSVTHFVLPSGAVIKRDANGEYSFGGIDDSNGVAFYIRFEPETTVIRGRRTTSQNPTDTVQARAHLVAYAFGEYDINPQNWAAAIANLLRVIPFNGYAGPGTDIYLTVTGTNSSEYDVFLEETKQNLQSLQVFACVSVSFTLTYTPTSTCDVCTDIVDICKQSTIPVLPCNCDDPSAVGLTCDTLPECKTIKDLLSADASLLAALAQEIINRANGDTTISNALTNHINNTSNPHTTTLDQARAAGNTVSGPIDMNSNELLNVLQLLIKMTGSALTDIGFRVRNGSNLDIFQVLGNGCVIVGISPPGDFLAQGPASPDLFTSKAGSSIFSHGISGGFAFSGLEFSGLKVFGPSGVGGVGGVGYGGTFSAHDYIIRAANSDLLRFLASGSMRLLAALDVNNVFLTNVPAPTQNDHAVNKQYTDNLLSVNDAMVFKGSIDASANPNYPAADKGHTYKISVAGKIGGGSGINVEIGDTIYCIVDGSASGTQAAVGANWVIVQTNIDGAVIGPASSTTNAIALFDGITGKLLKDSSVIISTDGTLSSNSDSKSPTEKAVKTYSDTKLDKSANLSDIGNAFTAKNNLGEFLLVPTSNPNTSSNVSSTVAGLSFNGVANGVYAVSFHLSTTCSGAGGIRFSLNGANISSMILNAEGTNTSGSTRNYVRTSVVDAQLTALNAFAGNGFVILWVLVTMDGTGGTVNLQFASGTNLQTSTVNTNGSFGRVSRVS